MTVETNGFKHVNKKEAIMEPLWERTGRKVSLHGLGFLQVELTDHLRIHVWHPDLPRRRCFEHSSIHNHRFGFESTVLVGEIVNRIVAPRQSRALDQEASYHLYSHEGPRGPHGNRGWLQGPRGPWQFIYVSATVYLPGQKYSMIPYVYHRTEITRHGRAATLMFKTEEHELPASSSCLVGVEPDETFDRFQMADDDMWAVVRDVLGG